MPLDATKVGATSKTYVHEYDWRNQAVYALGIGAKRDELAYLFEGAEGGMRVFPTYAVVPAFEAVVELLRVAEVDLTMVVHAGQKVANPTGRPIPSSGTLETVGTLAGIYDMKRFARLVITTESKLGGEPLLTTEWAIIVRDAGGFGGDRPPRDDAPKVGRHRAPDWTVEQPTSLEQALLYRISGDTNPLHADPAFAEQAGFPQGPILHGLCTYGHMARAVIHQKAGGDATKLRAMSAQFRKPVWPGDTIVTHGFDLEGGKVALRAMVMDREDPVVTNAWAQLH